MSVEAMRKALNYIENTEGELGIKLSCGDALREALASQPSPAATVETKSAPAVSAPHNNGERLPNGDVAAAGAGTQCSAASEDAGCGAAVITPWADQYNACWDRSKPDALKLAALKALNYIENTEDELGMKLSCGDALREALK